MNRYFIFLSILLFVFACEKKADTVVFETNEGSFTIQVNHQTTPKHAANFIKLAKEGFYEGLAIHKVIGGTLIEMGDPFSNDDDPLNDGAGDPGIPIEPELGKLSHFRGAVAAVQIKGDNSAKRSNSSQFYICLTRLKIRDGNHTVFGKVIENLEVVDKISWVPMDFSNKPKNPIIIKKVYLK
ncbi:MAG: peptidylprolyl isomerase [Calditrichaeota bacterium]|nr:MAG: peptidylprolyl isomerase [Calditrichota bacterium]MBL1207851.1 peptidylprolyl isomerase [Calditrichota bacterium]NOG47685.1 peptidylprolyl isomerase [Calditrichota bacterium]